MDGFGVFVAGARAGGRRQRGRVLWLALWLILTVACDDDVPAGGDLAADPAPGDVSAGDAENDGPTDLAVDREPEISEETGPGDMEGGEPDAADTAGDPASDADATGDADSAEDAEVDPQGDVPVDAADAVDPDLLADPDVEAEPDVPARTCDEIVAGIESERAAALACERSTQCAVRANPLCPFGGCFTYFTTVSDLSALRADEAAFLDDCGRNGCACPANPPAVLACVEGACGACPSDCPYTCALDCACVEDACGCDQPLCAEGGVDGCAALAAAVTQAVVDLGGCADDSDCAALAVEACPLVGCGAAIHRQARPAQLEALLGAWEAAGCGTLEACACPALGPWACVEGRCMPGEP